MADIADKSLDASDRYDGREAFPSLQKFIYSIAALVSQAVHRTGQPWMEALRAQHATMLEFEAFICAPAARSAATLQQVLRKI